MTGMIRNLQQSEVSEQRAMPVDDRTTKNILSVTAETVSLYYYNGTTFVLTADAGQVAGTIVVGKLANSNIANALGDVVGNYGDSSFSWITGTIFTKLKKFNQILAEDSERNADSNLLASYAKAISVTTGFGNGDYCIDHRTGMIYGKKATTGISDTCNYKIFACGTNLVTRIAGEDLTNNVMGMTSKPLAVSTYTWPINDMSAALEESSITKATPGVLGRLASVAVDSTLGTGTYYFHVVNSATVPADGAVTHLIAPIKVAHTTGTTSFISNIDFDPYGIYASAGIVAYLSSTQITKTIVTGNYLFMQILAA